MPERESAQDLAAFARAAHYKQARHHDADPLGQEMIAFFKQSVQKRQTKLSAIAAAWEKLVPPILNEHCALESLNRGTLTVIVDSSPHLYELRQLLLAGIETQLKLACKSSGLRKIVLKPGRWYDNTSDDQRPRF